MDVSSVSASAPYQPVATPGAVAATAAPAPQVTAVEAPKPAQHDAPNNDKAATASVREAGSNNSVSEASREAKQSAEAENAFLEKTINQVNKSLNTYNRELQMSVHKKTGRIMVKVMDTNEQKVIREIPPEKVLDAFAQTLELAGILIDKKR